MSSSDVSGSRPSSLYKWLSTAVIISAVYVQAYLLLGFLLEMSEAIHICLLYLWGTGYVQFVLSSISKRLHFQIVTAPGTEHEVSHNFKGICYVPVY